MASRSALAGLTAIIAVGSWVIVGTGQIPQAGQAPLPLEPLGGKGEAVFAAFEGWGPHKDGRAQVLLIGYFNRNQDQVLDIPVGPNNNIEPGGPDLGQPTHFMTGRKYGVFAIDVPKDFGNKRYTWTLVANGQKTQVSFWTNPPYFIDFFKNLANENEPPVIRLAQTGGPEFQGPPLMLRNAKETLSGAAGQPVNLRLWVSDVPARVEGAEAAGAGAGRGAAAAGADAAGRGGAAGRGAAGRGAGGGGRGRGDGAPRGDVNIIWTKYRGPGEIKFAQENMPLYNKGDAKLVMEAATTATFSAPGEYVVMATANDSSGPGGGGDQCCWSTAHFKVNIK
jgi:hypothetical protein